MRTIQKVLLALIFSSIPLVANAEQSFTLVYTYATRYNFTDLPVQASDKPVSQPSLTYSTDFGPGRLTLWTWWSIEHGGGKYGKRGTGDEIDPPTLTYNQTIRTPIGPLETELFAGYYNLAIKGLDQSRDDLFETWAEAGRPFTFGDLTLTPYVRVEWWTGMNTQIIPAAWVPRPGIRVSYNLDVPVLGPIGLNADLYRSFDVSDKIDSTHLYFGVRKNLGAGWSVSLTHHIMEGGNPADLAGVAKKWTW